MAVSFDSVTLTNPVRVSEDVGPNHHRWTFRCRTATLADATNLAAKWGGHIGRRLLLGGLVSLTGSGTKGSLVVGDDTYTNCMITAFQIAPMNPVETHYEYTVSFEKDTATP